MDKFDKGICFECSGSSEEDEDESEERDGDGDVDEDNGYESCVEDSDDSDDDFEFEDDSEHYLLRGRKKRIYAYDQLSEEEKRDSAKKATISTCRCSNGHCLRGGVEVENLIYKLRAQANIKSDEELFTYVRSHFDPVASYVVSAKRFKVGRNMKLGDITAGIELRVCRNAWANAHNIPDYIFRSVTNILRGDGFCNDGPYTDKSRPHIAKHTMAKLLEAEGIHLSLDELTASTRANSSSIGWAVLWLRDWIKSAGHPGPTGSDVIYCEGIEVRQLHDEYIVSFSDPVHFELLETRPLRYNSFRKLLVEQFRHVKFFTYKGVGLKCDPCAKFTGLRRGCTTKDEKNAVAILHMLHRCTYMGERHAYYLRQMHSMENSRTVWSFIMDGMQQDHCFLPHRGNTKEFSDRLPQHIQGVLSHFREILLFRTFHNYGAPGNLVVHSLLMSLERRLEQEKCLPDTIYIQIDGGGENRGYILLAVAELLVRLHFVSDKVVLTRLPAGHTHEDIDAHFGKIWRRIRMISVLTPQAYYDILKTVFVKDTHVEDVFLMPDYDKFFGPFVDKPDHYGSGLETQHQWLFKRVEICPRYPTGVKVLHRAYADPTLDFDQDIEDAAALSTDKDFVSPSIVSCVKSDNAKSKFRKCFRDSGFNFALRDKDELDNVMYPRVWEIHKADDITTATNIGILTGWSPVSVEHRWYPLQSEPALLLFPGPIPSGGIGPAAFYKKCAEKLTKTFFAIVRQYPESASNVVSDWHSWIARPEVPKTDDVQLYMKCTKISLHVPLRDHLFSTASFLSTFVSPKEKSLRKEKTVVDYVKTVATSTVGYAGNEKVPIPPRRLKSGLVFQKISPPYIRYSVADLRFAISTRGLVDPTGERKAPFKKSVYCSYLENADKFDSTVKMYRDLPQADLNVLLQCAQVQPTGNLEHDVKRLVLSKLAQSGQELTIDSLDLPVSELIEDTEVESHSKAGFKKKSMSSLPRKRRCAVEDESLQTKATKPILSDTAKSISIKSEDRLVAADSLTALSEPRNNKRSATSLPVRTVKPDLKSNEPSVGYPSVSEVGTTTTTHQLAKRKRKPTLKAAHVKEVVNQF